MSVTEDDRDMAEKPGLERADDDWRRRPLSPFQLRAVAAICLALAGGLFLVAPAPLMQAWLGLAGAFFWVLPTLDKLGTFDRFRARVRKFQGPKPRDEETSP